MTTPAWPGGIDPVEGETSYWPTYNKVPSGTVPSFPFGSFPPFALGSGFLPLAAFGSSKTS